MNSRGRSPSISPAVSLAREEPLIQPPPRSKWEREDDEEGQENGATEPKEPSPVPQRSRGREGQTEAPKAVKSEGRESVREERRGAVREDKKMRAPREEGKGGRVAQANSERRGRGRGGGRSIPSLSVSQASRSPSPSNPRDSGTTTTADKKKKKHKNRNLLCSILCCCVFTVVNVLVHYYTCSCQ